MTVLIWISAIPLIIWMAVAGLGTLMGHKMAIDTFDRLGYSLRARILAGIIELLMAVGVLSGRGKIGRNGPLTFYKSNQGYLAQ